MMKENLKQAAKMKKTVKPFSILTNNPSLKKRENMYTLLLNK